MESEILNENYEEDLRHLREWISQKPHLNARMDKNWLLIFLRGCKFSLQRAKEKLENYYVWKYDFPEHYIKRDPFLPTVKKVLSLGLFLPLPKINPNEPRYFYFRCKSMAKENVQFLDVFKVGTMIADIVFMEDVDCTTAKLYLFCDLEGVTTSLILQLTPSVIRSMVMYLRNGHPCQPQAFYYINSLPILQTLFNIIKPILGKKLSDRVKIYTEPKLEILTDNIPKSILPKEYGGDGWTLDELTVYWKKKVEDYRDWFIEDEKYYCDETKPLLFPNSYDTFGIDGSFRKLCVD